MSVLAELADDLAAGTIEIAEARARARAAVSPQRRLVRGVPSKVRLPTSHVEGLFTALTAYLNKHSIMDVRRWTATLVFMEARLGVCEGNMECEGQVIVQHAALIERVVSITGGRCQPSSVPFAEAIVDCVLRHPATKDPTIQARLLRTKAGFSACATGADGAGALFAVVEECFRREGWTYHSDPSAQRVLIRFDFPFGTTTLVCSGGPLQLTIVAVEVVHLDPGDATRERDWFAAKFPDIDFCEEEGTVSLQFEVDLRGKDVATKLVRDAVVHINGAAEALIMRLLTRD